MTREETKELFKQIVTAYPNFNPGDKKAALELWSRLLEKSSYSEVLSKLDNYITENRFPPTIADLTTKKRSFGNFDSRDYSSEFFRGLENL